MAKSGTLLSSTIGSSVGTIVLPVGFRLDHGVKPSTARQSKVGSEKAGGEVEHEPCDEGGEDRADECWPGTVGFAVVDAWLVHGLATLVITRPEV